VKISFSEEAAQDVVRLRQFLEPGAPGASKKAVIAILDGCQSLANFPAKGSLRKDGSRQLVIRFGASAYLARYKINTEKDEVVILRVRHGREAEL
jgi:plasmid stabilization system protein ParE